MESGASVSRTPVRGKRTRKFPLLSPKSPKKSRTSIYTKLAIVLLITNIITCLVLFERVETRQLCNKQHKSNPSIASFTRESPDNNEVIIPKSPLHSPNASPPQESKSSTAQQSSPMEHNYVAVPPNTKPKHRIMNREDGDGAGHCNSFITTAKMSLRQLSSMRDRHFFPTYDCPEKMRFMYRPSKLVPHILGNECCPFWPMDIVYILEKLLSADMKAVQYGCGMSSMWLSLHVADIKVVDSRRPIVEKLRDDLKVGGFDIDDKQHSNLHLTYERMGKSYVQQVKPSRDGSPVLDIIVVEYIDAYHIDFVNYAIQTLPADGGILIIKKDYYFPDDWDAQLAETIPPHWFRYNSAVPPSLMDEVPFSQEQYIEKSNTTIYITSSTPPLCH